MSPQSRAALVQLGESLAITSLLTALASVTALLMPGSTATWPVIALVFVTSFLFSLAHGIAAYFKAMANPQQAQLGQIIDTLITVIERRYPGFKDTLPIPPIPPTQNNPTTNTTN